MLRVALYGRSMVLAGIGARLQCRAGLHAVTIDATLPDATEKLSEVKPDIVVLDLATVLSDPVVALWKVRPELLVIGVDLGTDRMLILSGQPARPLTAEDLTKILTTRSEEHPPRNPRVSERRNP